MKKAEHWRIDAFELWCWRKLLRIPWTARRSNQSIPKEINPDYALEGLMMKLQSFGHLVGRANHCKDPDAGKDWRQEEKGMTEDEMVERPHLLNGHEFEQSPGDSEGQGSLASWNPWGHKDLDRTEWLNNNNLNYLSGSKHSWVTLSIIRPLTYELGKSGRTQFCLQQVPSQLQLTVWLWESESTSLGIMFLILSSGDKSINL